MADCGSPSPRTANPAASGVKGHLVLRKSWASGRRGRVAHLGSANAGAKRGKDGLAFGGMNFAYPKGSSRVVRTSS